MLFVEFFQWWYGDGWKQAFKGAFNLVNKVQLSFSLPVLLKTLFAPWKMIVTPPGRSMEDKTRAMLDNLVSRTVGFVVRFFSLVAALVLVILAGTVGFSIAIAWPLIPILTVVSVFKGLVG
jgi:hypothetical protein